MGTWTEPCWRYGYGYGLHGVVLQWLGSYLSGGSYCVIFRDSTSSTVYIMCSVPQGSLLGSCLFIFLLLIYDAVHNAMTSQNAMQIRIAWLYCTHVFMCLWYSPSLWRPSLWQTQTEISGQKNHHLTIHYKLNAEKTELLWAGSRYWKTSLGISGPSLHLGADTVAPSDHVRVIGVTISSDLSLERHVSMICEICFFWLA